MQRPRGETGEVVIRHRFRGPAENANGGYVAGLLASRLGGRPAEVTLRGPPPIGRPLGLRASNGAGVAFTDGGRVVAEAAPTVLGLEPPPSIPVDEARRAVAGFPGFAQHPNPECFVCGPQRSGRDGLRIFPGPLPGRSVVAAPWTPDVALGRDGVVAAEFVWAALDCPGAWASTIPAATTLRLDRLAVAVHSDVLTDTTYVVGGWERGREGRKRSCGSVLYDADGNVAALGGSTWVAVEHA